MKKITKKINQKIRKNSLEDASRLLAEFFNGEVIQFDGSYIL